MKKNSFWDSGEKREVALVKKKKKWFFRKPVGDSEVMQRGNLSTRTTSAITCGLCGTCHPELNHSDDGYTTFRFLGREAVMECCGKVVDVVYREWKEEFAQHYLEAEFASDPLANKYYAIRSIILRVSLLWRAKADKQSVASEKVQKTVRPLHA